MFKPLHPSLSLAAMLASLLCAAPAVAVPTAVVTTQSKPTGSYPLPHMRPVELRPKFVADGFATLFRSRSGDIADVIKAMNGTKLIAVDDIGEALERYYAKPKAKVIWVDGNGLTAKATQALNLLKQADDWGLNAEDYRLSPKYDQFPKGSPERAQSLAQFEADLSEKFLMFLQDNYRGRVDPDKLSTYYDFKRKTINLVGTLDQLSASTDLTSVIQQFTPDNEKFGQLAIELQWLRSAPRSDNTAANINKVIVAMEELRWLPQEFPNRYVFINQPAYMAYYHENGQLALSMKAVIGQENHQTNFFNATIKTVEFNPDWGVPQSIIKNEMLPRLRRDPSYLDREGYVVSVKGKTMPSAKVDWSQPLVNISVVQPPGPDNALGRLKILFPNSHDIYMHDTPARGKFAAQDRMFSHGCVRLQNPQAMAAAVLKTSVDFVDQQIADGAKKDMPVPEQLPVYVAYFTAWPTADGIVRYYDDVYNRDSETLGALAATSASRSKI